MKRAATVLMALVFCVGLALTVARAARVGERAPDFTATDSNGQTHKLSEYAGKYVVLEWTNRGCPTRRSTTAAAICRTCSANGLRRASSGSR